MRQDRVCDEAGGASIRSASPRRRLLRKDTATTRIYSHKTFDYSLFFFVFSPPLSLTQAADAVAVINAERKAILYSPDFKQRTNNARKVQTLAQEDFELRLM